LATGIELVVAELTRVQVEDFDPSGQPEFPERDSDGIIRDSFGTSEFGYDDFFRVTSVVYFSLPLYITNDII
jgi:hypothetical protein